MADKTQAAQEKKHLFFFSAMNNTYSLTARPPSDLALRKTWH